MRCWWIVNLLPKSHKWEFTGLASEEEKWEHNLEQICTLEGNNLNIKSLVKPSIFKKIFLQSDCKSQMWFEWWITHQSESHSVMSDSLWLHELYSPWNSPGENTGVGSLPLLQRIFLAQELNQSLLHYRWILYQLSGKLSGKPLITL